jgi:hypothetical protein
MSMGCSMTQPMVTIPFGVGASKAPGLRITITLGRSCGEGVGWGSGGARSRKLGGGLESPIPFQRRLQFHAKGCLCGHAAMHSLLPIGIGLTRTTKSASWV